MRSRVHNRTRDRGGKRIRLGVAVGITPGPSGGTGGALSKKIADKLDAKLLRDLRVHGLSIVVRIGRTYWITEKINPPVLP
jgi:hypothetical protein